MTLTANVRRLMINDDGP